MQLILSYTQDFRWSILLILSNTKISVVDTADTKQYKYFRGAILFILSNINIFRGSILLILSNTQDYQEVDAAYTKQYAGLSGVNTAYTQQYEVLSGSRCCLY